MQSSASRTIVIGFCLLLLPAVARSAPNEDVEKTVIELEIPPFEEESSSGGILVADVDDDGKQDFLVTVPGHVAVYGNDGEELWIHRCDLVVGGSSEREGLPGHHGPGLAAGDVDGDDRCEVVLLTKAGELQLLHGATGEIEVTARPPVPNGAQRWELAMIGSFRKDSQGRDLLLQATNEEGYRMGRYLAAYAVEDLIDGRRPLWETDRFGACAHNGARLADLDADGRDEVLGRTLFSPEGEKLTEAAPFQGHIDSVFVADVRPETPGLEVVLLEEGSNAVQVVSAVEGPIWRSDFKRQEPQNAAVGRFRDGSDECFIWCRSRYPEHQKPFVFDSRGKKVVDYAMDDVAPERWTDSGVEVIHTIRWFGTERPHACAKERHTTGDICIFDPLTGEFLLTLDEQADRLYVADVFGDAREEILVANDDRLHIYRNTAPCRGAPGPSPWTRHNYRRLKQCYNYYSP